MFHSSVYLNSLETMLQTVTPLMFTNQNESGEALEKCKLRPLYNC